MSHDDLPRDDPDVDAFERDMELRSLLKNLRLPDNFDPYKVIRLPTEDRSKTLDSITYKTASGMRRLMDSRHGHGQRFRSRSELINHAVAIWAIIERELSEEEDAIRALFDPVVGQLELESVLVDQAALDKIILLAGQNMTNSDRTVREKARTELIRAKRICEKHDDSYRLLIINQMLNRP